ncbi:EamA-like transporter family protein [Pseudonocardia thermophila]|jgi:EamA-like transporter family.|uniref:EamA-like transporter family protein n=1 Tax=Pseudonocardia thermophila TaxID=1848 RepID=A0A1M6RJ85_PSETH|nr:DMT family transporter [Pseudonocardia thermophila]SHK32427.1 EamA-like transporter family protein [Pseudonocardia thermophila]
MSVPFALPSALSYGIADFAGGLAARRTPVLVVTTLAQAAGFVALVPTVLLLPGELSLAAVGWGLAASVAGVTGLMLYLRGLAVGPMGIVAPLSAVVGAGLPLLVGVIGGERPGPVAWFAMALALAAIVMATMGTDRTAGARGGVLLGLAAGIGFGLFFVALDASPADSGMWPQLAGRCAATLVLGAIVLASRGMRGAPVRPALGLIVASGVLDTFANALFLVATRLGDLGLTSVVVSLYPVVVVVLARLVLGERLTRLQLTGTGLALGASALLAAAG